MHGHPRINSLACTGTCASTVSHAQAPAHRQLGTPRTCASTVMHAPHLRIDSHVCPAQALTVVPAQHKQHTHTLN
eukprot:293999-Chlamydomonas_euryale.AAC.2